MVGGGRRHVAVAPPAPLFVVGEGLPGLYGFPHPAAILWVVGDRKTALLPHPSVMLTSLPMLGLHRKGFMSLSEA